MLCKDNHRYWNCLENLDEAQAGSGRHKCAGHACEQGYYDALNRRRRHLDANLLPDSQAGTGRHKDVEAAYLVGYQLGLQRQLPS